MLTALLGTTLAEPPVHSDYLPPQNTQGLSSQYGVPQAQGFGISNYHESTASSSYQPPSNDLSQNSYGRNNAFDNNGNSYESSARDQIFGNLNSDSVSVDVVPHNGFNFRQPSQSYGAPSSYAAPSGNYHDSTQRRFSGQLSNAYGTPSSSPDHSSFGGQSRLRQLVAKYGAPTPSALSSKSRAFSHSFPRATAAANRYTSAITSNTYGVPFNSAFDNTFAALSNTYGVPSNGNDYSQHYSGNAFQGYGRKASTEDPLAVSLINNQRTYLRLNLILG